MIRKLKLLAAKRRIKKLTRKRQIENLNGQISTVAVIVDEKNFDFSVILAGLQKELNLEQHNFEQILCLSDKRTTSDFNGVIFDGLQIGINGGFLQEAVQEFANRKIDLLVSITENENLPAHLLIASSKAYFKVGWGSGEDHLFDLTILEKNNPEVFMRELVKYLRILKKTA